MNKKLLALAIGAVAALPVSAIAAGPTLYGQISVSLESVDDEIGIANNGLTGTAGDKAWTLRDNASRIGVRGEADTDVGDLKGIYQAEFGLDAADGNGTFTQRNTFVGLQGGFGTVKAGTIDTPLKEAQGGVDQFNDTVLDMNGSVANETRSNNVIEYVSPKIADSITIKAAIIPGEATGTDDGIADFTSISVAYQNEGLYAALALDSSVVNGSEGSVDGLTGAQVDATRAVVGYSTDAFEVGFLYQQAEDANAPSPTPQDTSMLLSGAYKMDAWKFKAQFVQTDGDVADDTVTTIALGADYALGKSTTASAYYGQGEVDSSGDQITVFGLGLKQMF